MQRHIIGPDIKNEQQRPAEGKKAADGEPKRLGIRFRFADHINIFNILIGFMYVIVLTGCGGQKRPDGMPELYTTSVKVTMNGNPLEGAAVTLKATDSKWALGAQTDAKGVAVIKTNGSYSGAPAGEYTVCISKKHFEDGPTSQKPEPEGLAEKYAYHKQISKERKEISVVDPVFGDPKTSQLKLTVADKGKTSETFEVTPYKN